MTMNAGAKSIQEMVLCAGCSDVVAAGGCCPTCGAADPAQPSPRTGTILDEALLERVDVALAAQAALACQTAEKRSQDAERLFAEAVALSGRLRRQSALLRSWIEERRKLAAVFKEALERVEDSLHQAELGRSQGQRWTVSARLPRDKTCARVARGLLEEYARQQLNERDRQDAMVITSELVTNAYVHGDGAITLSVDRRERTLTINVTDEGRAGHIHVVPENQREDGGRGLSIVDQLASDWDVVAKDGHVWAELALSEA